MSPNVWCGVGETTIYSELMDAHEESINPITQYYTQPWQACVRRMAFALAFFFDNCPPALPSNKNPERVAAGYKATIHNPTVSQAAKKNAEQQLREMGVSSETGAGTQHAKQTVDTLDETEFSPDPDVVGTCLAMSSHSLCPEVF